MNQTLMLLVALLPAPLFVLPVSGSPAGRFAAVPVTRAAVLVNQVGYDSDAPKPFVFQAPAEQRFMRVEFRVLDAGQNAVLAGVAQAANPMWGARYWTGDFSGVRRQGRYTVEVTTEHGVFCSSPFTVGEDAVFRETVMPAVNWFRLQRCGDRVAGWHAPCHLDDAALTNDGARVHRDRTGGWHNAGDWNKYTLITCRSVYALAEAARNRKAGLSAADRLKVMEEAVWGCGFLLKMWQPGKGKVYQDVWFGYGHRASPDLTTDNVVGTGDDRTLRGEGYSAMAAAALAAVARETGRKDFREAAVDLWRGAAEHLEEDTEEIWNGWEGQHALDLGQDVKGRTVRRAADLLFAAVELERLTGEARFAESARRCVGILQAEQGSDGLWPTDAYSRMVLQGMPAAALALYCRDNPKTETAANARALLRKWTDGLIGLSDSPFGIVPFAEGVFFCPRVKRNDGKGNCYLWGQNSQYLSDAWALYQAARLLDDPAARRLADRQMDWVLGLNKLNLCMMEGQGSFNPPRWHHAWGLDPKTGKVPGAVANGITRAGGHPGPDEPWFDLDVPPESLPDYSTAESWEPHNAFFILAVAARSELNRNR